MDATTAVVVDTDVISFLFKNHSFAPAYQAILAGKSLAVSLISLAEIEFGMDVKNWGRGRRELMRRFLGRFNPLFPDAETAVYLGTHQERLRKERPPDYIRGCLDCSSRRPDQTPAGNASCRHYNAVDALTILTAPTTL